MSKIPSLSGRILKKIHNDIITFLHPSPCTPGVTVVSPTTENILESNNLIKLPEDKFLELFLEAREAAHILSDKLSVERCALVSYPEQEENLIEIKVLPLHGLDKNWKQILCKETAFNMTDPGYCNSKDGPKWTNEDLKAIQSKIRQKLPNPETPHDYSFYGEPSNTNLFPKIIRGELEQWRIWEDKDHVAFLTLFPNTPGFTVLVPRKPLPSDIFSLGKEDYTSIVLATQKVGKLLQDSLDARGIAIIFEGLEIDYAHVKLIPVLSSEKCTSGKSDYDKVRKNVFFESYQGYVTSVNGPKATDADLDNVYQQIIDFNK